MPSKVTITSRRPRHTYDIEIGTGVLRSVGSRLRTQVPEARRVALVSNPTVYALYGDSVTKSIEKAGFTVKHWLMRDGERFKDFRSLEEVLQFFSLNRISRSDAIVGLGGGVVGDLAGFAAAVYLRGVSLFQLPTTLLAMIDSSVGGKTGINTQYGKNIIGSFYQPKHVFVDIETLKTLPPRELTAGLCEAVKHAAIGGVALFNQFAEFVEQFPDPASNKHFADERYTVALSALIRTQVRFKAAIVRQDEREDVARSDALSRKILNFGHTFAHALEKVTRYRRFKHGEAVGHGILFAAELSKILEIGDANELKLLYDVVHRVGRLPSTVNIDPKELFAAFDFDKKLIAGSLQWVLLRRIGEPVILSGAEVPSAAVKKALKNVLSK